MSPKAKRILKRRCRARKPEEFDFFELFFDPQMQSIVAAETDLYCAQQTHQDTMAQVEQADEAAEGTWSDLSTDSSEEELSDEEQEAERQKEKKKRRAERRQMEEGKFQRPWVSLARNKWRLLAFVGVLILMGTVRQPVTEHFKAPPADEMDLRLPAVLSFGLTHLEFEQIMRYLHFADNTKQVTDTDDPNFDKAYKVRALLERFRKCCLAYWVPGINQAIDEMMIRFKGRLGWRQYMKDKPIKFGIKMWGLAESTLGYITNFDIYCGKKGRKPEKGLARKVVQQLVT